MVRFHATYGPNCGLHIRYQYMFIHFFIVCGSGLLIRHSPASNHA